MSEMSRNGAFNWGASKKLRTLAGMSSLYTLHRKLNWWFSARDTLFSAVHPLLELIGRYSGCYVSLIAAGIPENRGEKPYITRCVSHIVFYANLRVAYYL